MVKRKDLKIETEEEGKKVESWNCECGDMREKEYGKIKGKKGEICMFKKGWFVRQV